MTGDVSLTGALVGLRGWRLDDLAPYREWLRPHHEWHAWDGPYFPRPTDAQADEICAQLRRRITAADWPTPGTSLVIADRDSDVLVGCVTWYYESEMCAIGSKLGWTEEARFRDARVVRGQPYDSVVYGVLRREWSPTLKA